MIDKYETQKKELLSLATSQQMAAADPNMSVWVEASAGTGKTKVLSDRVLRLLLARVEPAKILCLTYTKAAAVEMNERIAKKLSMWAVESDEVLSKELSKLLGNAFNPSNSAEMLSFARTLFAILLDTPGGMKIQTIHSFCQDVLKRFPLEAGVSPYFEVLDDRNAKEILQNIQADLLRLLNDSDNSELYQAVTYLTRNISEYRFPEVMNMITQNRSKIELLLNQYKGKISDIVSALENKLHISYQLTPDNIKQFVYDNIDKDKLKVAIAAFLQGGSQDIARAETLTKLLNNNFIIDDYDEYKSIFLTDKGTIRTRLATKNAIKYCPDILEFMQKSAEDLVDKEKQLAALSVLHTTIAVLQMAKNIINRYNIYKEAYAVLDYEDLIIITRRLLENKDVADWVLYKLDGGIDHVLIDEAQDTSPNQWAIIRALTQEFFAGNGRYDDKVNLARTVFVVGDRKQSIYSFQGADPKEFDKMYRYFNERIHRFAKIQLDVSFRSTKAVMDCVNTLFASEEARKGVIPDGEHINHLPFRLGDGGQVEILPLIKTEQSTESNYAWTLPIIREQTISPSNILAKQIAQNIKDMVINKEILASQNRPIRYGDFMFLVQQRNAFVEEFVRACKSIGVKVAGVDKLKLLEQIAVQDLISLGKFLLLPTDDLSLAEVLKSPIFGLDDDDLFKLCYNRKNTLFNSIITNNEYISLADSLKKLLNMSGYARPFELFNYILINMKGRQNFISRMGNDVEDVLDEFLNLTLSFEMTHTPTLENFITWIVQDEVIIQKEMEQGEADTVKIMTVHGSKGLQAPIVILADAARIKNKTYNSEILWDDDLMYFPSSAACYEEICTQIKDKQYDMNSDEYRRLLYVALTRAEDRLYIAGYSKDTDAKEESWYKLLEKNLKSNIPQALEDKRIIYQVPQENQFDDKENTYYVPEVNLVNYKDLMTPAPMENALSKPYAPSRDNDDETELVASPLIDNGHFYKRGTAIHKLLQYISTLAVNNRYQAAQIFLIHELPELSSIEIEKIITEVLKLCETYQNIFQPNSMAEVPIIGEVEGKIISAKIDRLVIEDNKIIIVDYKTNRPAAKNLSEVPPLYIKQLQTYKMLLAKMYPKKEIETYILWTNTCNMMKI